MAQRVAALHLLCKHSGSRNPTSRRTGQSTANVTKESAHEELKGYIAKLQGLSGADLKAKFEEFAKERSDCGTFSRGGDLGEFGPGEMQKQFEDATYALKVGEMSGIVDSDSGSHIILRYA
mmetsp:Transcript_21201/g.51217  ORF Transcript_21201/g.51217 Transcript_21201/m.51217 type:complete len:121 (-) Transcript_21201:87-449(-)